MTLHVSPLTRVFKLVICDLAGVCDQSCLSYHGSRAQNVHYNWSPACNSISVINVSWSQQGLLNFEPVNSLADQQKPLPAVLYVCMQRDGYCHSSSTAAAIMKGSSHAD